MFSMNTFLPKLRKQTNLVIWDFVISKAHICYLHEKKNWKYQICYFQKSCYFQIWRILRIIIDNYIGKQADEAEISKIFNQWDADND